jgi:pimeloyl-ACP methyl ester carboxylesterase
MKVTDNLQNDISHAPDWFHDSIAHKSEYKTIVSEDHKVAYKTWGNKDHNNVIFLVHGTGAHMKWWDPIAPQFSDTAYVVAIDLPGMGDSAHREDYSFECFSKAMIDILDYEQLIDNEKNIILVGHSLGGHVAGFVATEHPNIVDYLVMIDTPIRPPDYDYAKHRSTGPLRMIKYYEDKISIVNRFRLMPAQECENDWYLRYIGEHSIYETEEGWRWKFDDTLFWKLGRLSEYKFNIQCKALYIYGGNSMLLGSKILNFMEKEFEEVMDFVEVPGAAHHVPLDKPLEIVAIIKSTMSMWGS